MWAGVGRCGKGSRRGVLGRREESEGSVAGTGREGERLLIASAGVARALPPSPLPLPPPCRVPDAARGFLGYVLSHLGDSQILPLMEAAVEARAELAPVLTGNRELLYLDLALEDQVWHLWKRNRS